MPRGRTQSDRVNVAGGAARSCRFQQGSDLEKFIDVANRDRRHPVTLMGRQLDEPFLAQALERSPNGGPTDTIPGRELRFGDRHARLQLATDDGQLDNGVGPVR